MAIYLNLNANSFISDRSSKIYVDKSLLIKETNANLNAGSSKFMCVTRPRRFGKTFALSMLNAYYSKGCDSRELFKGLKIYDDPSFKSHLNKHNVFCIDMGSLYANIDDPGKFVQTLKANILSDLQEAYPSIDFSGCTLDVAFSKIRTAFADRFIFLIDEWDVVYREEESNRSLCDAYTKFLRALFKSWDVSSSIDLVYMTGILPIRRYSTQSTLNMFTEYNMVKPRELATLFGFTEDEVKSLCAEHGADFAAIKNWYDGYKLGGAEMYNPKSVVEAIRERCCGDYWTATSSIEAVTEYMNYDGGALKSDILKMLSGEKAELNPSRFKNDLTIVNSKDAALTVLVHLGYLAFVPEPTGSKGFCYIPNKEIAEEFENALEELDWSDIYDPISNSEKLLKDTLAGNAEAINEAFDRNHKELASPFSKNDENVLSIVAAVSYYKARNHYWVKKEEISMNGRSDISFFPKEAGYLPLIVELKAGHSPEEAIEQIKSRRYWDAWDGYKGKVLLVGINYDEKTLKHTSKVEWIDVQ
jgi:hypothetical protein